MTVAAHSSMAKSAPSSSPMSMCRKHEDAVLISPIMNWIWSFLVSYRHSPSVKINIAQLVSNEDGTIVVPTYNWTNFFASHLKKIIGIKKLHHFHFTWLEPGVCYVKERADTPNSDSALEVILDA